MSNNVCELKLGELNLTLETGEIGRQANGTVLISYAGVSILVSSVMSSKSDLNLDFFPLQVNYVEKYYSVGRIPGGFVKREGRPKDKEILISRLIDRPLRPLFNKGFRNEVQITAMTMAADNVYNPDVFAIIGASVSLLVSDIPFNNPIGAVRVGYVDSEYILNPTSKDLESSLCDIIIVGTSSKIVMIDGCLNECSEGIVLGAIEFAKKYINDIIDIQNEFASKFGKTKKEIEYFEVSDEIIKFVYDFCYDKMLAIISDKHNKELFSQNTSDLLNNTISYYEGNILKDGTTLDSNTLLQIKESFSDIKFKAMYSSLLENGIRVDGRKVDEIRSIKIRQNLFERTHGSSLFTRGETQSLAIATLGSPKDAQKTDDIEGEGLKNFVLHYNFPSFCVGEVGRFSAPSRREIGHGSLAEKSFYPILPSIDDFPYTIRLVSEILESNGSSSMASVCSGSMAMVAAGIPIKKIVSGIAMGVLYDEKNPIILTDIQGLEDAMGHMDFKLAGTTDGLTSIQLDLKNDGIDIDFISKVLQQARKARLDILEIMYKNMPDEDNGLSKYAPKIISFKIDEKKIKDIIGPGGKVIRKISDDWNSSINIDDDGKVTIYSNLDEDANGASNFIKSLVETPKVNKIYSGIIKRIEAYGLFISILPNFVGLCHVSNISKKHISFQDLQELYKCGDTIEVKCTAIDDKGRVSLSANF